MIIPSLRPDGKRKDGFPSGHTQLPWSIVWYRMGNVIPSFLYLSYLIGILRYIEKKHYMYQIIAGSLLPLLLM